MNRTVESTQKDVTDDFTLADLLSGLIKANIQSVVVEVVSRYPKDQRYPADVKVGCCEAWIDRLCGMLTSKDRDYLLQLLQNTIDKPSSRS